MNDKKRKAIEIKNICVVGGCMDRKAGHGFYDYELVIKKVSGAIRTLFALIE